MEVDKEGKIRIPHAWQVAYAGLVVNHERAISQFEGAAVMGAGNESLLGFGW